ncbi:MAG: hypothetical protein E5Y88_30005 [Mesorhizobium sp.]|nr:MAG: hypothetical protein EOS34_21735 [Mesorhizobium sp.]RWO94239.1 MAG: hypothetical protein EOQ98_31755 [Mesorhizobium sp.]RWQ28854.1 MAG: hypothetical protein EOS20_33840 [Mesorhizobium sp.]RWQ42149.1 MAG: hypothetical protein EOS21_10190 [Mesorhizobium sp.]RWQ47402.1 MAG: hypothetical protein EOS83_27630 [Mesorhizobium sp.]
MHDEGTTSSKDNDEVTTVARSILSTYFADLAEVEGFGDVATRLRKTVLEDGKFADAHLRAALFDAIP